MVCRVLEEINEVLEDRTELTAGDVNNLVYMEQVFSGT